MSAISILAGALLVLLCSPCINHARAASVGRVISVQAGAFAERKGETVPLALKSQVYAQDTLVTDATGKVQVLFDDDSSITLSPGTRISLTSVVPHGAAPEFKAGIREGMARFITGKIVERNPEGFSVMTPETTIGIRGTIFAVQRDQDKASTSVFVLNTARQVFVNGISVPGEHKLTMPGGRVMPMTPADIKQVTMAASLRPRVSATANAPAQPAQSTLSILDRAGLPAPQTDLNSSALLAQESSNALGNSIIGASSFSGNVSGTLTGTNSGGPGGQVSGAAGQFSFHADLGSGRISNGSMSGNAGTNTSFSLTGGSGSINGSRFNANGFSGTMNYKGSGAAPANGYMSGGITASGGGIKITNGRFGVNRTGGGYIGGTAVGGTN